MKQVKDKTGPDQEHVWFIILETPIKIWLPSIVDFIPSRGCVKQWEDELDCSNSPLEYWLIVIGDLRWTDWFSYGWFIFPRKNFCDKWRNFIISWRRVESNSWVDFEVSLWWIWIYVRFLAYFKSYLGDLNVIESANPFTVRYLLVSFILTRVAKQNLQKKGRKILKTIQ